MQRIAPKWIAVGIVCIMMAHQILIQWPTASKSSFVEADVSDEHIDDILLSLFEQCQTQKQDIGRLQSIMTDIGRLFSEIDSMHLLARFRNRLDVVSDSLRTKNLSKGSGISANIKNEI